MTESLETINYKGKDFSVKAIVSLSYQFVLYKHVKEDLYFLALYKQQSSSGWFEYHLFPVKSVNHLINDPTLENAYRLLAAKKVSDELPKQSLLSYSLMLIGILTFVLITLLYLLGDDKKAYLKGMEMPPVDASVWTGLSILSCIFLLSSYLIDRKRLRLIRQIKKT